MLGFNPLASAAVADDGVIDSSAVVTGVAAQGFVGTVAAAAGASATPTGLSASGAVGTVAVTGEALVFFEGWGRNAWGQGAWSQPIPLPLQADGQVGSVTVQVNQRISVNGFELTPSVGSVTVTTGTGIDVDVTGVSASVLVSPWGVLVWGRTVPDPGTSWTPVVPDTTTSYTQINP